MDAVQQTLSEKPAPAAALKPSGARHWVVGFAVVLAVITYIDRVALAQAAPQLTADLGLSQVQLGWAFSAFGFAYFLFQIPGGWLSDWIGPRRVLTGIVLWWSLFTAATGWAWNFASLVIARFLFGAGQGGGFPVLTKTFTTWLPSRERVRAQGVMWLSARWGGAFTPLLVVSLLQFLSWRRAFELFAVLGVIWAVVFFRWFRDSPAEHKGVNAAELALVPSGTAEAAGRDGHVPWGKILRSKTVWALWLQYYCMSHGWYFYITWLPTYLQEARGVPFEGSAVLAGLPLFFGGLGSISCGFLLSRIERTAGGAARARRFMAALGCFLAGTLLAVSVHISSPLWAMILIGLASFSNDLAMPPGWGACMDVGGRFAGTLSGSMNAAGNVSGFVAPASVAYLLVWTGQNWDVTFYVSAAIYFIGAACWFVIDPVTPLEKREDLGSI